MSVIAPILFLLILDILSNHLLVAPDRTDVVPPGPKGLACEVPYTSFAMPGNPDGAFSFDVSDDLTDFVFRGNGNEHVHMIRHHVPLFDPAVLLAGKFP